MSVVSFPPSSKVTADVTLTEIWSGSVCEDGDFIFLAHEQWREAGTEFYTIGYTCPSGEFEIVQKFPFGPEYLSIARFAAEIADRTLATVVFMQPEPAEGGAS